MLTLRLRLFLPSLGAILLRCVLEDVKLVKDFSVTTISATISELPLVLLDGALVLFNIGVEVDALLNPACWQIKLQFIICMRCCCSLCALLAVTIDSV